MTTESDFDSLVPAQTFDRRSFLVTSLGAGFALATQPVMAQTVIKTDDAGLRFMSALRRSAGSYRDHTRAFDPSAVSMSAETAPWLRTRASTCAR